MYDAVAVFMFKDQADFEAWIRVMETPGPGKLFREDEHRFLDRPEVYSYSATKAKSWSAAELSR